MTKILKNRKVRRRHSALTMTFGTEWGWGSEEDVARAVFNTYIDAGGNFIDTANVYTEGRSEELTGRFIAERSLREQVVLATKFTFNPQPGNPNAGGRYYGFSDTPAWYVARAKTISERSSNDGLIALQLEYSLVERNIEREHIPAAQELGLGITPWSPLAGGFLTGKYQQSGDTGKGEGRLEIAKESGNPIFHRFTEPYNFTQGDSYGDRYH